METLRIDVWSDIACPWCYVGKRRLEAALARFPHANAVRVVWRAFELDPAAPRERDRSASYPERLAAKYGTSTADAEAKIASMCAVARAEGLDFRFDRIRPGNTFDAHRLIHLAGARDRQDAVKERFLRAYLTEGAPIGDPATLALLAIEAGLDPDEVHATLGGEDHAVAVREDEREAAARGIGGVPCFAIAGAGLMAGAQPAEQILRALTGAWGVLATSR